MFRPEGMLSYEILFCFYFVVFLTLQSKHGEYYESSGINAKIALEVTQKLVAIRHDEIKDKVGGQAAKDAAALEAEKSLVEISDYVWPYVVFRSFVRSFACLFVS
jgi:hypothetical protein